LTVLIATRDRAEMLARTLDAYASLVSPAGGHRIVVVDDGSRDATASVLAARARVLPLVTCAVEHVSANAARNRAVERFEGDLVVMSDDDTTPARDWLVHMRAAADAHPEAGVIVGTVRPRFEVDPPAWVLAAVRRGPAFGWVERDADGFVDPTEGVGASVAIRRAHFDAGARFDESVGPDGTAAYAMGSETELLLRLARDGVRAWYARDAVVHHHVSATDVEVPALLRRAYRYGRGRWRLGTSRLASARFRTGGVPWAIPFDLWARRRAHRAAVRRGDDVAALRAAWRLAYLAGHVAEIRRARGEAPGLGTLAAWLPPSVLVALEPVLGTPVPTATPRVNEFEPGGRR